MKGIDNTDICAYGVINKNSNTLLHSSSGGVVPELCSKILKEGGSVCTCIYNYDFHELRHALIKDVSQLGKMESSKYFQSDITEIFSITEEYLKGNKNKKLLFIGTPCQCAAIKSYFNTKHVSGENLICVDIICHGVGSNQIWNDFTEDIEKKNNDKIVKISFKDKRYGWLMPYAVAQSKSGKEYDLCDYMTLYNKNLIMRDECYECPFSSVEREGDITVGDFWNVKKAVPSFYNEKGVSSVLCNTEKGKALFLSVIEKFYTVLVSTEDCIQPNMMHPTEKNPLSDKFWIEYQNKGFRYVRKKYASKTMADRIKRHLFVKIGLWKV